MIETMAVYKAFLKRGFKVMEELGENPFSSNCKTRTYQEALWAAAHAISKASKAEGRQKYV